MLDSRFLEIEHATRLILSQIPIDRAVANQLHARSLAEQIELPSQTVDRVEHLFIGS